MSKCGLFLLILMVFATPAGLHAIGMGELGDMGGMGMVDIIQIKTKTVGTVVYKHSLHSPDCNMCHPKIFKKMNNSNHVTMKAMEKGQSCGACHNGKKAFTVAGNCTKCHAVGNIIFQDENVGNITFSHSVHIEMLEGCDSCHPKVFKAKRGANKATMADMKNGKSCGACHDGSGAFGVAVNSECAKCHAGDILFKDEDAGNVNFPHTTHIEILDGCDSCHPDLFKAKRGANKATMADMESGKSCGACHDGSGAFSVAEDCESCHQM